MEYKFSNKKEILIHNTTPMNLINITLSERQPHIAYSIYLKCPDEANLYTESKLAVA